MSQHKHLPSPPPDQGDYADMDAFEAVVRASLKKGKDLSKKGEHQEASQPKVTLVVSDVVKMLRVQSEMKVNRVLVAANQFFKKIEQAKATEINNLKAEIADLKAARDGIRTERDDTKMRLASILEFIQINQRKVCPLNDNVEPIIWVTEDGTMDVAETVKGYINFLMGERTMLTSQLVTMNSLQEFSHITSGLVGEALKEVEKLNFEIARLKEELDTASTVAASFANEEINRLKAELAAASKHEIVIKQGLEKLKAENDRMSRQFSVSDTRSESECLRSPATSSSNEVKMLWPTQETQNFMAESTSSISQRPFSCSMGICCTRSL